MEIGAERLIAAVPDRVMRALMSPGEMTHWGCEAAQVDDSTSAISLEAVAQTRNPPAQFTRLVLIHSDIPGGSFPAARDEHACWQAAWVLWLRNLRGWVQRAEAPGSSMVELKDAVERAGQVA